MYRIYWRAILTGATGCGTGTFPLETAQRICDELNVENRGILHHYILPSPPY